MFPQSSQHLSLPTFLNCLCFCCCLLKGHKGLPWYLSGKQPAKQETWVQSLDQEDPLEKEMAPHSSILAWEIPWTEELVGYSLCGLKESDTT